MKHYLIALVLLAGFSVTGCKKTQDAAPLTPPALSAPTAAQSAGGQTGKGQYPVALTEDDDRRIVIRVKKRDKTPIRGASLTFTHNTVTKFGITDDEGECPVFLSPEVGWGVSVAHTDYDTTLFCIPADTASEATFYLGPE